MDKQDKKTEMLESAFGSFSRKPFCSRRQFLKVSGVSIIGISTLWPILARGATKPLVIMEKAQGIVVADPIKCVGCGRCELACTEFIDGKAAPTQSRIKVDRNLNFGPKDVFAFRKGQGNWGNGLVVQDICVQCPHPVPCANACPEDAIVVSPTGNVRVVDSNKCNGCKICLKACPWEMISFDLESRKATKCFLCHGKPKCVEACPSESLSYVPWYDLTNKVPPRIKTTALLPPKKDLTCQECHLPGVQKNLKQGLLSLFWQQMKDGKPVSLRNIGFKWIDLVGVVLLPLVLICVILHAGLRTMVKR
jgi:Fe-S-cluster-containing dehydrogenase component